ncbi:hypothetical protein EVAR_5799_1 [Eumeta japonica]|uniref:Uncharacterized protein n=1 Tax=Eumeta variegata TaxID=151549 RepID=A0A4C1T5G9_EUMVA|nr:hypothetical protein EVAR_5799_1 [Eumeta japonica]
MYPLNVSFHVSLHTVRSPCDSDLSHRPAVYPGRIIYQTVYKLSFACGSPTAPTPLRPLVAAARGPSIRASNAGAPARAGVARRSRERCVRTRNFGSGS